MSKSVQRIVIKPEAVEFASDVITEHFFGANFLLGRDSLSGTFAEKVGKLGVALIRYPGGSIAENFFDIADPDIVPVSLGGTYETLAQFLEFCRARQITPTIVIPTARYALDPERGVLEVQQFAGRLASGEFGDTSGLLLEIGNEYYATQTANGMPMSADQYGALASQFARVVDAADSRFLVSVQAGRNAADNAAIMRFFDTSEEIVAIDIVSYHDYPWRFDEIDNRQAAKAELANDWTSLGIQPEIYLSEWNIGSDGDQSKDSLHDYGLKQVSSIIEMVSEAAKAGVDYAAIWAVQQNNKTSLTGNEGSDQIRFAGQIFAMLQESLPGKRVIDDESFDLPNSQVKVHGFEDATEIVLYITAREFDDLNTALGVDFNLQEFGDNISLVSARRLTGTGEAGDHNASPIVEELQIPVYTARDGAGTLFLEYENSYDVIEIVLQKFAPGPISVFISGSARGEAVDGGSGNDVLLGRLGNDRVRGNDGADYIDGGWGNDLVDGSAGNDQIVGNIGKDLLRGGAGADRLFGGAGRDILNGGSGNDVLSGGAGRDEFIFGTASGNDRINDFEPGTDNLRFQASANDSWQQSLTEDGLLITFAETTVLLANIANFIAAEHFI